MQRVRAFLLSLNEHSDRLARQGHARGEQARLQYDLAQALADEIERETGNDSRRWSRSGSARAARGRPAAESGRSDTDPDVHA
jgi:hypothetical protein